MSVTEPILTIILCLAFLRGTSAGCDLPSYTFVGDLSATSAGMHLGSTDATDLEDHYITCTSVYQNDISKYTSVYLSLIVDITQSDNFYYARWSLACNTADTWDDINSTYPIEIAPLPTTPVFLNHSFNRTDCYSCSSATSNDYGCLPCHDNCLKAGVDYSLGLCYGPSESECCSYSLGGMCVGSCPIYHTHNTDSVCECVPNRSGSDCSICDVNCGNGTVDADCTVCSCFADYSGARCENQFLPCTGTPCTNEGVCIDGIGDGNYTCECINMWNGTDCTNCPIVCENSGAADTTCSQCNCVGNWLGDKCNECPLQCFNGGEVTPNCDSCICVGEWEGSECRDCGRNSCLNGGVANSTCDGCNCTGSWNGSNCETCPISCVNGVHNDSCEGCDCEGNWGGPICATCQLTTCENGGSANSTCDGCNCVNSWEDASCSTCNISCYNGGSHDTTCSGCDCVGNWVGSNCTTCGLNCAHGTSVNPTCTACQCPCTLMGNLCDEEVDLCYPNNSCGDGGNCTDLPHPGTYLCDCEVFYILMDDKKPVCVLDEPCDPYPCYPKFSHECINIPPRDYRCVCVPDIIGQNCTQVFNNCDPNPCVNGGCTDGNETYSCECPGSFRGINCSICTLTCSVGDILNTDTCVCEEERIPCGTTSCDLITEVCDVDRCICKTPAFAEGIEPCINNNECLGFPCHQYASCMDSYGSYFCDCYEGFSGDGTECVDLNDCSLFYPLCGNYPVVCTNSIGGFDCNCPSGYTYNLLSQSAAYCVNDTCKPRICTDINECGIPGTCGANQDCKNTLGGYFCNCKTGFFPAGHTCEKYIGSMRCESMTDGTGTVYPTTPSGVTITKPCPNTLYGVMTRTCIPSCSCTADDPVWGYSNIEQCVNQQLVDAINLLRRFSIRKLTNENSLIGIIGNVGQLVDDGYLQGKDFELTTVFIHEIELVIRDWPASSYSLPLSEYEILLKIADYLLSQSAEGWEETDNSTANIFSIVDTLHKIGNRISIYLYENSQINYTFEGNSFLLKLLRWDNYTLEYTRRYIQFPENSNHFVSLPYIESDQIELPGRQTAVLCKSSILFLQMRSINSLLSTSLSGSIRRNNCINRLVQTPRITYEFISSSISIALTQGVCGFARVANFPPDDPYIVSLPNSPIYQETNKMFYNTKLNTYTDTTQPYTPFCSIQPVDNDVVSFHCQSLNHYIPLLVSPVEDIYPTTTLIMTILIKVFLGLSVICCLVALLLMIFKIFQLREGLTFVRFNVVFSIMLSLLIFLVGIDRTEIPWLCTMFAVLMQYFAVCTTIWSLIDTVNLILVLTKYKLSIYDAIYFFLGYLVPFFPIPFSVGLSFCSYTRPRLYCWVSSESNSNILWAISAPLYLCTIVLTVSIVILILAAFSKRTEVRVGSVKHYIKLMNLILSSCLLPFILILTWLLATYSFDRDVELVGHQICFITVAAITGVDCLFLYTIASSEKFPFSEEKVEKDEQKIVENRPNPARRVRESLINPIFKEDDEDKRASTAYTKRGIQPVIKNFGIYIEEREQLLVSSKK